jgi:hypothetical protein
MRTEASRVKSHTPAKLGSTATKTTTAKKRAGHGDDSTFERVIPRAVAPRQRLPASWKRVARPEPALSKLYENDDPIAMRLANGRVVHVPVGDDVLEYVKAGAFQVYRDPSYDPDVGGDGPHYLVPAASFRGLEQQLVRYIAEADAISERASRPLDALRDVMHAGRADAGDVKALAKVKAEVMAAIPAAKRAIVGFEREVADFERRARHLEYKVDQYRLAGIARAALDKARPRINSLSMRDLGLAKDVIRANELLLARPEVLSVDPGFGVRISVDTDTLVKNGGDYNAWKIEVQQELGDALITTDVNFSKGNRIDLKGVVGPKNVPDHFGWGDKDFADGVRGLEVTIHVNQAVLARARRETQRIAEMFVPHGYDLKHLSIRIEEDR